MNLKEILSEIDKVESEAQAMVALAKTENRSLTDDETKKIDGLVLRKAELKTQRDAELSKPAERTVQVEQAHETRSVPKTAAELKEQDAERRHNLQKAMEKISFREFCQPEVQRAITTSVGLTNLVDGNVINYLQEFDFLRPLVTHKVASANLTLPVSSGVVASAIIAENSTLSEASASVASVSFGAWTNAFVRNVSQELLNSSSWNVIQELDKLAGLSMGLGELQMVLDGSGTSEPQGLLVGGTNGTTATTATTVIQDFVNLVFRLPKPYRAGAILIVGTGMLPLLATATYGSTGTSGGFPMLTYDGGQPIFMGKYPVYDTGYGLAQSGSTTGNKVGIFLNPQYGYAIVDQVATAPSPDATEGIIARNLIQNPTSLGVIAQYYNRFDGKVLDPNAVQVLTVK